MANSHPLPFGRRATLSQRLSTLFLCCTLSFISALSPLTSAAQVVPRLDEPQAPTLSLEQEVDAVFGAVVGGIASVFLWDVIFWDQDEGFSERASQSHEEEIEALIADPLGWGVFVRDRSGVSLKDVAGKTLRRFVWKGVERLSMSAVSPDGRWLYLVGEERLQRHLRGTYEAEAIVNLPSGTPSVVGTLNLRRERGAQPAPELIFGASDGRLYREVDDKAGGRTFERLALGSSLQDKVVAIAQRKDGAYWAAASRAGQIEVYDARLKEQLVGQVSIDPSFGEVVELGFLFEPAGVGERAEQRLWARTSRALVAWDASRGEELFTPITLRDLRAVHATKDGYLTLNDGELRLIPRNGLLPGTLINERKFKGAQGFVVREGVAWVTLADGGVGLMNVGADSAQPIGADLGAPTPTPLMATDKPVRFVHSGDRLITAQGPLMRVWAKVNLNLPLIVLWLVLGAIFFTVRMRFVNVRLFKHAIDVVRGRYDDPESEGEVSHFQALTSALSATVGLGNIAGVAIAVSLGGPGATFWMIMAGVLGMASKFTECTLGQKYRHIQSDGHVMGGAMYYLSEGLGKERGWGKLGKGLAVLFAFLCVGGSFGGGNAFQVKQSLGALKEVVPALEGAEWLYGLIMMGLVAVVILGGIKSIARTAEKIVPVMCGLYVIAALYIILANLGSVPSAFGAIIAGAFAPDALYGGFIGVLVVGFQRAAFSNEAGIGSAAIAHAAAKTAYPVREGIVALLEPFIDTVLVCTMTALVIVITGAHENAEYGAVIASRDGAALTSLAMGSVISFAPHVLSVAVALFAYSTMISWSYYGERCWAWLFGEEAALFSMGKHASLIYRALFLSFVFLGSIMTAGNILDFSDLMILGMAFPNIFGLVMLSKGVKSDLDAYEAKLNAGELELAPVEVAPVIEREAPVVGEEPKIEMAETEGSDQGR